MHALTDRRRGARITGTVPVPRVRSTESAPIYLVAPAGHPNYGDEFILRAWLRHLAVTRPGTEVVVDCHTPGQAAVLMGRCHPRVRFTDTIWRICFETAALPVPEAVEVTADIIDNPGRLPRIASGVTLLSEADTVHLVGGGYLNTVWPQHLTLMAAATAAARRFGARAAATGQGLVPAGDADRVALLRTLVRDFTDGLGADGVVTAVRELADRWGLRGDRVAFIEGIPGTDRHAYDRLVAELPDALFVPFVDLWNRGLPARPGQTWISTRFHPHLLAAAAGANGIALTGPNDYYGTKHQSLLDAGSRWQIADAAGLPDTAPTAGGFPADEVNELTRCKTALADRLYPSTPSTLHRTTRALRSRWR